MHRSSLRFMFASYDRVTQLFKWMLCRYFAEPADEFERAEQEDLFRRMLHESVAFHFWNGSTCALVPEPNSLVDKLLNQYRLHCLDVLWSHMDDLLWPVSHWRSFSLVCTSDAQTRGWLRVLKLKFRPSQMKYRMTLVLKLTRLHVLVMQEIRRAPLSFRNR